MNQHQLSVGHRLLRVDLHDVRHLRPLSLQGQHVLRGRLLQPLPRFPLCLLPHLPILLPLQPLHLLLLLLTLEEGVGSLIGGHEIEVEEDEVEEEEGEDGEGEGDDPGEDEAGDVGRAGEVSREGGESDMDDQGDSIGEGGKEAGEEVPVVTVSYAVIEPHAVVVEVIDAAVAGATVLATRPAVTVAELAEQHLLVLRGKLHLPVVPRPLVVVHHAVSRVRQRRQPRAHHHPHPEHPVRHQQARRTVQRQRTGEVDCD